MIINKDKIKAQRPDWEKQLHMKPLLSDYLKITSQFLQIRVPSTECSPEDDSDQAEQFPEAEVPPNSQPYAMVRQFEAHRIQFYFSVSVCFAFTLAMTSVHAPMLSRSQILAVIDGRASLDALESAPVP